MSLEFSPKGRSSAQNCDRNRLFTSSLSNRSIPFPDFKDADIDNFENTKPLPNSPRTSSLKHRRPVPEARSFDVPTVYIEPPILAQETKKSPNKNKNLNKTSKNKFMLPVEELKLIYQDLVRKYKNEANHFSNLERKRKKTMTQIEILEKQVKQLEKEQAIVDTEFVRLGLHQPQND